MTKLSTKEFIDFRLSELKEKGIDNARIVALVSTAKSIPHVKHITDRLFKKYNDFIALEILANKWNITIGFDFKSALENIDKANINKVRKKINDYVSFIEYKTKCVDRLIKVGLPATIIMNIRNAKTKEALQKLLEPIPYQILREQKLVKAAFNGGITTQKSVKAIYTNMKNQ